MRTALLIASLQAACFGMIWRPFQYCTDTHQVDSTHIVVHFDESMRPELAPYHGHSRFRYHPGTCIPAWSQFKPYYMDTLLAWEGDLSADRRRLDIHWVGQDTGNLFLATQWYSAAGEFDSSLSHSISQVEGLPPIRRSSRVIFRRSTTALVITASYRTDDGPWEEFDKDSVVVAGGVTTVHSIEDSESSVIRCAAEGSTYVCEPTPAGGGTGSVDKLVWHLTGNRPDSLRTFRPDGRLESTEHWSWSPRTLASIRRPWQRVRIRAGTGYAGFNLLGRVLPKP